MWGCSWTCCRRLWHEARVYGRTRGGGRTRRIAGDRDVAQSVSGLRDRDRESRIHVGVPEDGAAGLRQAGAAIRAGQAVPGAEVVQDVPVGVPQPGHFPGERSEPGAARRSEGGEAEVGYGGGGLCSPGWPGDDRNSRLESPAEGSWKAM